VESSCSLYRERADSEGYDRGWKPVGKCVKNDVALAIAVIQVEISEEKQIRITVTFATSQLYKQDEGSGHRKQ
jgi:hypothetical protein